ncbi:MAG: hypothetical protein WDW38_001555 [Sanguina aurantia]
MLTYSFTHIISISHIHVSLVGHHRTAAFCAFTGCRLADMTSDLLAGRHGHGAASPNASTSKGVGDSSVSGSSSKALGEEEQSVLDETTRILSTRVCGSPAVDGYAHVLPKCLEQSPTAQWWSAYYKGGGKQQDLVVHIEKRSDYDGLAVFWGIKNTKNSSAECGAQCLAHQPGIIKGPYENLPCNAFAFCPEDVCFEPDAHTHTKGDCWLKFTEGPVMPEVNMRGDLPDSFRSRHAKAPKTVQWESGVLLPPGVPLRNGTWGPRWLW